MDSFMISSLDIMGSIFIYGPFVVLAFIVLVLIVLRLINHTTWINWDRVKQLPDLMFIGLPISVAIGIGFRAASYSMQPEYTLEAWLCPIAAGAMLWLARRNFLKREGHATRAYRLEQDRTGHADDDNSWNPNSTPRKSI